MDETWNEEVSMSMGKVTIDQRAWASLWAVNAWEIVQLEYIRIYIWAVNTWEFVFEFWSFDLMNNYNIFELSAPEKSFMIFCCLIWWQNGIHLKKVGSAADMPNKNINLRMHTWKSVGMLPSRGSLWDILESSWMVTLGLGHMSTHLRSKDSHTGKQKSE